MSYNITVEGGKSVRLKTAGKYCDRDILVTATGGAEDLNDVLNEQEALIEELKEVLAEKASGGGAEFARSIVDKTITAYNDSEITAIGGYAFVDCDKMTSVNLQNATYVGQDAFNGCSALTDVNLPNAKTVGNSAFQNCTSLTKLDLP